MAHCRIICMYNEGFVHYINKHSSVCNERGSLKYRETVYSWSCFNLICVRKNYWINLKSRSFSETSSIYINPVYHHSSCTIEILCKRNNPQCLPSKKWYHTLQRNGKTCFTDEQVIIKLKFFLLNFGVDF